MKQTAAPRRYVVGISGASGAPYAERLLFALGRTAHQVEIVASKVGADLFRQETGLALDRFIEQQNNVGACFKMWAHDDYYAPFASGSQIYDAMAVVPCSSGVLGRVASGVASDLLSRACDVFLKERRRLVLLVREAPFSEIHLQNMLTLCRAGAVVMPASPGFYTRPRDMEELLDGVVQRVLDHMGLEELRVHRRWREQASERRAEAPLDRPV